MKRKILILIVAMITIINVFSAIILYSNLISIESPETTVEIELIQISPDEAIIQTNITLFNPNSFEIIIKNLKLVTKAPDGETVIQTTVEGGNIGAHKEVTYDKAIKVNFSGNSPDQLETKISGTIGMKSGFIEKIVPLSVKVITNLGNTLEKLAAPAANIQINFGEISQQEINITMEIDMFNPNSFELRLEEFVVDIKSQIGKNIGKFVFSDAILASNSQCKTTGNGSINIEALNYDFIFLNLSGSAVAKIAGFEKSIPVNINATIKVPDIEEILPSIIPTDGVIISDYKVSIKGLVSMITLKIINPNKIEFNAKDITFATYRIDKNSKILLGSCSLEGGIIKAEGETIFKGELITPYRKLFIPPAGGKIIPDYIEINIRANVTILGLNSYFWVGVIALQDMHPLK